MSKLLNRPLRLFTLYALFVLGCSIPVYYYIINHIWASELDEHNLLLAEYTRSKLKQIHLSPQELAKLLNFWNKVQPGVVIRPYKGSLRPDRVYTVMRTDKHVSYEPIDGFRGLDTYLYINDRPYQLIVETNIEEAASTMTIITLVTLLFFLILLVGFLLLNRYIAIKVWQPFRHTLDRLKEFDLNRGQPLEFEPSNIIEFEELNAVIEKLIARNLATFHVQKEFTENASHELQTPLAIMQSKLDLLLQESALSKKQHQLIRELGTALSRASRVNKNLLTLAKIDNRQFEEVENVNLSQELEITLTLLAEHMHFKEINLQRDIQPDIYVLANKVLTEVLVQNLIFNAYRHSARKASLTVGLDQYRLFIANSGEESLPADRLFKRFSAASTTTGAGLGLAIVKQICVKYQWDIMYTFEKNRHCFAVRFK